MKRTLFLATFFLAANTFAQQISDYRYVQISDQPKDFAGNRFGLQNLLASKLKAKNYHILSGEISSWPDAAKANPCTLLHAEIHNSSSFLKNKLRIDFMDCKQKTIASAEGKSGIKEYEPGYREALDNAVQTLPASNALATNIAVGSENPTVKDSPEPSKIIEQKTTPIPVTKEAAFQTRTSKPESKAEIFSSEKVMLNRIFISDSQFILANPNNSTPYAIFKATTKKDVYRVQLQDGTQTLGYFENGNIVIELQNNDGTFRREIFVKK